ncbi:hypothetical protein ACFQPA_20710 [Halomarina halobia]|uniref:Uncharacterized protein n=1 Tax=Halomarina halobia TaxID=3033386 RepID=A0ABD6AED4_9EURY|nr:hypothetical protein [Halomarina sp. PSR21]
MITFIAQTSVAPTIFWVSAATVLLVVLFVLLVAPYFGVFGDRDIDIESNAPESPEGL